MEYFHCKMCVNQMNSANSLSNQKKKQCRRCKIHLPQRLEAMAKKMVEVFACLREEVADLMHKNLQLTVAACTDICVHRIKTTYDLMISELVEAVEHNETPPFEKQFNFFTPPSDAPIWLSQTSSSSSHE